MRNTTIDTTSHPHLLKHSALFILTLLAALVAAGRSHASPRSRAEGSDETRILDVTRTPRTTRATKARGGEATPASTKRNLESLEGAPLSEDDRALIVTRARLELSRVTRYTPEWVPTSGYPMGDIPKSRGACTDLVVRALRVVGLDLQELVHEDILSAQRAYKLEATDRDVDHRRVAVLFMFFQRHLDSWSLDPHAHPEEFHPGDIVFFGPSKRTNQPHVAIVSDRMSMRGMPLILENGGPKPVESDALDARPLIGHFRVGASGPKPSAPESDDPIDDLLAQLIEP